VSRQESDRWKSEEVRDLLAIAALVANRFQVMQPPADWNRGRGGGGDLDCWIEGLDPQWPLRLPPRWRLVQALQDRFSRWQWWLEGPHGNEILDTTEDPTGLETGIGKRAMMPTGEIEAPPAARAVYLTQKRLYKGMLDTPRWQEIASLAAYDPSLYGRVLQKVFGKRVGHRIAAAGLRGVPPDARLVASYKWAQKLQFVRLPVYGITYGILGAKRILRRLLLPTGLMVLVVGPDGSGKSTLAAELLSATKTLFRRQLHVHWTPGLLPPISRLFRRPSSDFTVPHGQERHSVLISYLALMYYWLDNIVGGWGVLRHARRRTGLVLVERGWWDFAIDPRRYRMKVAPRVVRLLGSVLPSPDVVIILHGPAEAFAARKRELPEDEIDRQLRAWRDLAPSVAKTVSLDASRPVDTSVSEAREWIAQKLETRTAARVGTGWLALPPSRHTRFLLPRGPARTAVTGLRIYHPMTSRGRLAWETARLVARLGGLRLSPRSQAPPRDVRELLSEHIPRGGTVALQRTNHKDRWVALVLNSKGEGHKLIKLSTATAGSSALQREAENVERFASRLVPPLLAPRLLHATMHALVFEPVDWSPRRRPWHLPPDVAYAFGRFASTDDGTGAIAHGDFAPWNLFRTREGWVIIDWEAAGGGYPLMFDLFHYVVQSHTLLGRPTLGEIERALDRQGKLGHAMSRFVSGAGSDWDSLHDALIDYLHASRDMLDPEHPDYQVSIEARDRLLAANR